MTTIYKIAFTIGLALSLSACGGQFVKPNLSDNGQIARILNK